MRGASALDAGRRAAHHAALTHLGQTGFMGRGGNPGRAGVTERAGTKAEDRRRRLAEALRENLKKRRRQAHARSKIAAEANKGEGRT